MEKLYVGIDVSKESLDVSLRWDGKRHTRQVVANSARTVERKYLGSISPWPPDC